MIFSWQDADEVRREAVGLTRDISATGAFVATASPPPVGVSVRIKAFLPPVRGATRDVRIYGQGLVVGIEPCRGGKTKGGFEVEGKPFVVRREEVFR